MDSIGLLKTDLNPGSCGAHLAFYVCGPIDKHKIADIPAKAAVTSAPARRSAVLETPADKVEAASPLAVSF